MVHISGYIIAFILAAQFFVPPAMIGQHTLGTATLTGPTGRKTTIFADQLPSSEAGVNWNSLGLTFHQGNGNGSPPILSLVGCNDGDQDGLTDGAQNCFEEQIAAEFTPVYHVSQGEPNNFATFYNYVPETVYQRLGPNPFSYFRVKPLGFLTASGKQYSAVQVNYLTLWDQDNGLSISSTCTSLISVVDGITGFGIASILQGLGGHRLDHEHSAVLLLAPAPSYNVYDFNPADYSAYSYYTAAHEGTEFDQSAYLIPASPIPANNHLNLWLSLSKHSTYTGNPNGLPLTPESIQAAYFFLIESLYSDGEISWDLYSYLYANGAVIFGQCIVEHMGDQGGRFASTSVNVGEPKPGDILNNAGFILDTTPDYTYSKLTETIWSGFVAPLPAPIRPVQYWWPVINYRLRGQ